MNFAYLKLETSGKITYRYLPIRYQHERFSYIYLCLQVGIYYEFVLGTYLL